MCTSFLLTITCFAVIVKFKSGITVTNLIVVLIYETHLATIIVLWTFGDGCRKKIERLTFLREKGYYKMDVDGCRYYNTSMSF